jgi:hypothetical protein
MSNETRIISCVNSECVQQLRIPLDRTRLMITCPKCRAKWLWTAEIAEPRNSAAPEEVQVEPRRRRVPISLALWLLVAVVMVAGVWTRAWLPTGLFALSALVAWRCRRKLSESGATKLWEKGAGVIYEATAGLCCAIATGLALVIGLVTFLNSYPNLSPTNYPRWLLKLDDFLIKFSAWNQSSNNRLKITVVYLSVILMCFLATLVARRYKKEWKPVRHLTGFKKTANKVLLAIQVVALFSLFSQTPVNEHVDRLARELSWRYGVAKRAEQEFEARRLLASELTKTARDQKDVDPDEKSSFVQSISGLRNKLSPNLNAQPTPSNPPPNFSPNIPPGGPTGWRPPNWPRPPDFVLTKFEKGKPLKGPDYQPTSRVAKQLKEIGESRVAEANQIVATQVESAVPREPSPLPDPILSDPQAAKVFPPKTTDQWQAAKELVAEQELKTDLAERRYGEAVEMLLEGISEYLGMHIEADPIVGTWVDLALNALTDRVYDHLFSKDSTRFARVTEQLRGLFTPRETKAASLKEQIDAHLKASEYDAAEPLIAELQKYPKTKAGKSWALLDETVSFEKVSRSLSSLNAPDETITTASNYLSHHAEAKHAKQVRGWLASATQEKNRIEIEAAKPRMLVYVRGRCSMSEYFLQYTSQDSEVIAQKERFHYQLLDIDQSPPAVTIAEREVFLPIVVFKDRDGRVLDVVTGRTALLPAALTMHMRAVAEGRSVRSGVFENPTPDRCPVPELGSRWLR